MKAKKINDIEKKYHFEAPVYPAYVPAGLPDYRDFGINSIDLNEYLAPKPESVFLVRVSGESMKDEHIYNGDILIVNNSEIPEDGSVVIASMNGEMVVKTLREIEGKVYLFSANKKFLPIEILESMEFRIQGVVKHVIRNL